MVINSYLTCTIITLKTQKERQTRKKILELKILSRTSNIVLWSLLLRFLKMQKGGNIADIRYDKMVNPMAFSSDCNRTWNHNHLDRKRTLNDR